MKLVLFYLALLLIFQVTVPPNCTNNSVDQIEIPKGKTITVDGKNADKEWADANQASITLPGSKTITIFYKHDEANLLFAFTGFDKEDSWYPEILIDPQFDRAEQWQKDDWWFHVSYSDCASRGRYNDYSTCRLKTDFWTAYNCGINGSGDGIGHPAIFEVEIPFKTLELEPNNQKEIGLAFNVTDTETLYHFFPVTAKMERPTTWAKAVLQ